MDSAWALQFVIYFVISAIGLSLACVYLVVDLRSDPSVRNLVLLMLVATAHLAAFLYLVGGPAQDWGDIGRYFPWITLLILDGITFVIATAVRIYRYLPESGASPVETALGCAAGAVMAAAVIALLVLLYPLYFG